ncbi:MAG: zinc finger domain-containing protein [Streptosporangiaceae bacterium]
MFRRHGQPCQACGTVIVRTRVPGRATNLCRRRQTL